MNMMKKTGGFTLVELIVVIAILAILAAVAVPAYSGYISKANEAKDLSQLDAIKTAAAFAYTEKAVADNLEETNVETIEVTAGSTDVIVNEVEVSVADYTTAFDPSSEKFEAGASWDAENGWVGA